VGSVELYGFAGYYWILTATGSWIVINPGNPIRFEADGGYSVFAIFKGNAQVASGFAVSENGKSIAEIDGSVTSQHGSGIYTCVFDGEGRIAQADTVEVEPHGSAQVAAVGFECGRKCDCKAVDHRPDLQSIVEAIEDAKIDGRSNAALAEMDAARIEREVVANRRGFAAIAALIVAANAVVERLL
jgi:hypothetical protein